MSPSEDWNVPVSRKTLTLMQGILSEIPGVKAIEIARGGVRVDGLTRENRERVYAALAEQGVHLPPTCACGHEMKEASSWDMSGQGLFFAKCPKCGEALPEL